MKYLVQFLNKMPINSNGKLDKVKLAEIIKNDYYIHSDFIIFKKSKKKKAKRKVYWKIYQQRPQSYAQ